MTHGSDEGYTLRAASGRRLHLTMTETPTTWHTMSTQVLLEQAWVFANQLQEGEAGRCISALVWRLRGSEEWIESLNRRREQQ